MAITLEAIHAVEALEEAFAKYEQPENVNTDQRSQFTATAFADAVLKHQPVQPKTTSFESGRPDPG